MDNIYGIDFGEHSTNVEISSNVFYDLDAPRFALRVRGSNASSISIFNNEFQLQGTDMQIIETDYLAPATFFDNIYNSDRAASSWFKILGTDADINTWRSRTGDNSTIAAYNYPHPNRSIDTYQAHLGKTPTLAAFISEAKKQSKFNWRREYTASAVNDYIRAGFCISGIDRDG